MKLIVWNVQYGLGLDGVQDLQRVIGRLRSFDLVMLNEVDVNLVRSGSVDQVEVIKSQLEIDHHFYGQSFSVLEKGSSSLGGTGNLVLSRLPILYARNHTLPVFPYKGSEHFSQSFIEVYLQGDRGVYRIILTHLTPLGSKWRCKQIQYIQNFLEMISGTGVRQEVDILYPKEFSNTSLSDVRGTILCGDMNFNPDSKEYDLIVGEMSSFMGRQVGKHNMADSFLDLLSEDDSFNTHEFGRLDYVFASEDIQDRVVPVKIDEMGGVSDHKALLFDLCE